MFSIIIPTYNSSEFLQRCLSSVRDQSLKEFEVIVVDNYSNDNTEEIVNNFRDLSIKFIKSENIGNVAQSRNEGIKNSKFDYIAFLDSDDWWTNKKLEINKYYIEKFNSEFLYHDLFLFNNEKNKIIKKLKSKNVNKLSIEDILSIGNPIYNSSVVCKKELLKKINYIETFKELIACEDMHTWLKLLKKNPNTKYINKTLGFYNFHNGGISKKNMYWPSSVCAHYFTKKMNFKQKKKIYARLVYVKISFLILKQKTIKKKYFKYVMKNSVMFIKIKIFFKFLLNYKLFYYAD